MVPLLVIAGACRAIDLLPLPSASELRHTLPPSVEASVSPSEAGGVTPAEEAIIEALVRFARTGARADAAAIPYKAEGVALGLSNRLVVTRTSEELAEVRAWTL